MKYFRPLGYIACIYESDETWLVPVDVVASTESNVLFVKDRTGLNGWQKASDVNREVRRGASTTHP